MVGTRNSSFLRYRCQHTDLRILRTASNSALLTGFSSFLINPVSSPCSSNKFPSCLS